MTASENLIVGPIPGSIVRHYNGGRYVVICVADTHEHNGDKDVVYLSLKFGKYRTRPLMQDSRKQDSWSDRVRWPDGVLRSRFIADDSHSIEFFAKMFPGED